MLTKLKNYFSKEAKPESDNKSGSDEQLIETVTDSESVKTDSLASESKKQKPESDYESKPDYKVFEKEIDTESVKTDSPVPETMIVSDETPKEEINSKHSTEEIKAEVIKVLKTCYDPEIPVDVWELGLIYEINIATNGDVLIVMTLTSPSCPVAGILPGEIEQKVKDHPMVNDCKVQLTFDPPWSQMNMSEVAKLELGFL